jgi:Protein of unknown function (DUF664)
MIGQELAALFNRDLLRLRQQIDAFPDDPTLWTTVPGVANSAGTLVLHLEGNLREYVGRQLGGLSYRRDRPAEFSARDVPKADLVARATRLQLEIPQVIAALDPAAFDAAYPEVVLGVPLTTRQFLVHLNGHFNYHLGQIDYLRRVTTGQGALALAALA